MIPIFDVIESLCIRGNTVLEDRIGFGPKHLFVIDGASGLTGLQVTDHSSDAAWLAEGLRQGLERLLPDLTRSPEDILREIAARLKEEFDACWKQQGRTESVEYPSAGVAIFRLNNGVLEYFGIGDCTVTLEHIDGTIEVISETQLTVLDQAAIEAMTALSKETGCGIAQARKELNSLLIHNRKLRNQPKGYWIFDPSGVGLPHGRNESWPAGEICAVTAMTDGYAQLVEPFHTVEDLPDLHGQVKSIGLKVLAERLFSLQNADPECSGYPRFKQTDDTSALWAKLV